MKGKMLTSKQVAEKLGLSEKTVSRWRSEGVGPPYHKLGFSRLSPVRYDPDALETWMKERGY